MTKIVGLEKGGEEERRGRRKGGICFDDCFYPQNTHLFFSVLYIIKKINVIFF